LHANKCSLHLTFQSSLCVAIPTTNALTDLTPFYFSLDTTHRASLHPPLNKPYMLTYHNTLTLPLSSTNWSANKRTLAFSNS